MREMEWMAADDFNIARCHCPPHNELHSPKTTARCTGLIYWLCCCSHKPHTKQPPADSAETRLYNLTTSTLVLLAIRWSCLLSLRSNSGKTLNFDFKDICLFLDGSHFYQSCVHKAGLFSNRHVALNMWPLWIQMSEEKNACTLRRSSFSVPENLIGEWIPAEQEHGSW